MNEWWRLVSRKEMGVVGDKGDRDRKANGRNMQGEWRYSTLTIASIWWI